MEEQEPKLELISLMLPRPEEANTEEGRRHPRRQLRRRRTPPQPSIASFRGILRLSLQLRQHLWPRLHLTQPQLPRHPLIRSSRLRSKFTATSGWIAHAWDSWS